MTNMTTSLKPKGRILTPYVMIWVLLASGSLAYLALLAFQPSLVANYLGGTKAPKQITIATAKEPAAQSDLRIIQDSISQIRVDLQDLRAVVSGYAMRERQMSERLAALEGGPAAPAKVAVLNAQKKDPPTKAVKTAAVKKTAAKKTAVKKTAKKKATAKPAKPVVKVSKKKPSSRLPAPGLETGSVAPEKEALVSFGPAIVTPAVSKPVAIQIASGPSVDALRLSWSLLSDRHGKDLKSLQPRYITGATASGLTYDLVAGPITSASEAERLCKELGKSGTSCRVSDFSGDAL
jgi:hypothetical protein